ncbi:hypothetical protein [Blastomonas sp.]|uniref:BPSS1187 family protein n=1 Tax=Blastomonas sp. TaxID=1909299 RepID=UPI0035934640
MQSRKVVLGLLASLAVGCGSDAPPTPSSPPVSVAPMPPPAPAPAPTPAPPPAPPAVAREIAPAVTDFAIDSNLSPHFVINPDPAVAARGKLFVMLPGTGAVPRTYRLIVRTAAERGYHAIGLTYPNDDAVATLCSGSTDPECAGNVRQEILTGANSSSSVSVNSANSITGRLVSLLRHLALNFPNEGWGQYLSGSSLNWALITVGGHSQGSGHAAFIGKTVTVDRVAMFSGPADPGPGADGLALWMARPGMTPASRHYGLTHTADPLVFLSQVRAGWRQIGLDGFGVLVSVDGGTPPFGNTRQLSTSAPPNPIPAGITIAPAHGSPVADAVTPIDASGQPLYRPVWVYMAFP